MSDSASIYESGDYLENNPDWHAGDAPFKARWIAAILRRNGLDPRHIVEIGCGSGQILVELARELPAARLEGYDVSSQAIAIAAPKANERLTFRQADYFAVNAERPDLLMAVDVFEHVPDYMGFIEAMKPRAEWKLFHIPLDLSVQGLLMGTPMLYTRRTIGHLHYFCKDTALATLSDCGLEVVDWHYTHGAETLPHRKLKTRLFNLARKLARAVNEDFGVRLTGGASMLVLAR